MSTAGVAAFRVDATQKLGGGHAMRCLTLANALSKLGLEARIFAAAGFSETVPASLREGIAVRTIAEGTAFRSVLAQELPGGADILIFDHYDISAAIEAETRRLARCTLVIDDLADRPHDCDILLDQTVGRASADYAGLVEPQCVLLVGGDYCLVRPEFPRLRRQAMRRRVQAAERNRLLISMGLTDVGGITGRIVAALPDRGAFAAVDVLLDAGAESRPVVEALAEADPRIVLHLAGTAGVAELMVEADVAIGAAGSMSWERCCLGLPTVMLKLADNQSLVAAQLVEHGAACLAASPAEAAASAAELAADPQARTTMARRAAGLIDGNGVDRVVRSIMSFLERAE
jgi:UDP-2,4-diacetamido-2,4,6-trideoxy-beta-L-altropyranose hydrolase